MIFYDIFRYGHGLLLIALQTMVLAGIFIEWRRNRRRQQDNGSGSGAESALKTACNVSVIIPIHNESARMEGLLRTLLVQTYPAEIIFINDRCTDESPAMLAAFAKEAEKKGINCRIITLNENSGANKKQFALLQGIAEANGDYFLFTDGDCEVQPNWIRAMVDHIQDEKTGAVIGPVFKKKEGKGFFCVFQCYDHAVRYIYLKGSIGLGAAGGGFGNNLIISRKALEAAGGYNAVPSSPTEDAALISHIRSIGLINVRAIANHDAIVETAAEKTWSGFINQTLRWNNGGIFSPDLLTRFNYNLLMLVIGTGVLAVLLLPVFPELWPMPAGVLVGMIENSIGIIFLFRKKMPKGGIKYFLSLLFMPVFITLLTIMSYLRVKTTWKKEIYQ